ncbi:hypothetical protein TrVE_jg1334 [Triparma verrucosa]|uniref:S1 motif domain-containing protein n=1 Tax=Triparma verrucosa TaxID=1606542 RepID=A0A9W7KV90_9STRA|nr:hypothetical protein TrVE_jg1334 [Triparma verrucosa]
MNHSILLTLLVLIHATSSFLFTPQVHTSSSCTSLTVKISKESEEESRSPDAWAGSNPKLRTAIVRNRQNRARARQNKQKREPKTTRKRRLLFLHKETTVKKKRDLRVTRTVPLEERAMLKDVKLGSTLNGQVISVVNFGAFIDVGCEKDVLLHVKDMSEEFISHPSTLVSPGDTISVYVKYSQDGKVGLSLLENSIQEEVDEDVIQVEDLDEGDELWGVVLRSTNFGFFISVGTSQPAFLHFMDHSDFPVMEGTHPKDYGMEGEKVRVWVKEVDVEKGRVKVQGNRPDDLPRLGWE